MNTTDPVNIRRSLFGDLDLGGFPIDYRWKGSVLHGLIFIILGIVLVMPLIFIIWQVTSGLLALEPFIVPLVMAAVSALIGLFPITLGINRFCTYGTLCVSSKKVVYEKRSLFGLKQWSEPISNYQGLNGVIRAAMGSYPPSCSIRLLHNNDSRCVTLFDSDTSFDNFLEKWERYASFLNLPRIEDENTTLILKNRDQYEPPDRVSAANFGISKRVLDNYLAFIFVLIGVVIPMGLFFWGKSRYQPLESMYIIPVAFKAMSYAMIFTALFVLTVYTIVKGRFGLREYYKAVPIFLAGFMFLSIDLLVFTNGYLDTSSEHTVNTVITDKKVAIHKSGGRSHLICFYLYGRKACEVKVNRLFYEKINIGNSVSITYGDGYHDLKWLIAIRANE